MHHTDESNHQLYEILMRLDSQLSSANTKLELVHAEVKKTNGRVTTLEKWQWKTTGMCTVVGGVVVWLIERLR